MLVDGDNILWSLQVDHQLSALTKLDIVVSPFPLSDVGCLTARRESFAVRPAFGARILTMTRTRLGTVVDETRMAPVLEASGARSLPFLGGTWVITIFLEMAILKSTAIFLLICQVFHFANQY